MIDDRFRCEVTKNICGTDTWKVGYTCPCASCQEFLRIRMFNMEQYENMRRDGFILVKGKEKWKVVKE